MAAAAATPVWWPWESLLCSATQESFTWSFCKALILLSLPRWVNSTHKRNEEEDEPNERLVCDPTGPRRMVRVMVCFGGHTASNHQNWLDVILHLVPRVCCCVSDLILPCVRDIWVASLLTLSIDFIWRNRRIWCYLNWLLFFSQFQMKQVLLCFVPYLNCCTTEHLKFLDLWHFLVILFKVICIANDSVQQLLLNCCYMYVYVSNFVLLHC